MQVYLLKDLPGKGRKGEIINVNDGYGHNYIIKNKIGTAVDAATLQKVKAQQVSAAYHTEQEIKATREIAARLAGVGVKIAVSMGAGGKMFGSVTAAEIAAKLSEQGFAVDKKHIQAEPIKALGTYKIKVKFAHGVEGEFTLSVVEK
jgi:large subunit ribosomal protein L9